MLKTERNVSADRPARPLGDADFVDRIERALGQIVRLSKRDRKPKRREK